MSFWINVVREDIYDMLMEYACESRTYGFCDNCPHLRYHEDIGCWDCPDGLAVDSCEFSPQDEINDLADIVAAKFAEMKP